MSCGAWVINQIFDLIDETTLQKEAVNKVNYI